MSNLEKKEQNNVTADIQENEIFSKLTDLTGIPITCPFPVIEKCQNSDCRYLNICQSPKTLAEKHTEIMMQLLEIMMIIHDSEKRA